jgi:hypothetical protein
MPTLQDTKIFKHCRGCTHFSIKVDKSSHCCLQGKRPNVGHCKLKNQKTVNETTKTPS